MQIAPAGVPRRSKRATIRSRGKSKNEIDSLTEVPMPYYEVVQRILIAAISAEVITLITVAAVKILFAE